MKKNIKDFADSRRSDRPESEGRSGAQSDFKLKMDAKDAEAFARQYQGKSESEIEAEIRKVAAKGKADGSLNMSQVESFAESLAPMLNRDQKRKLDEIMRMLGK